MSTSNNSYVLHFSAVLCSWNFPVAVCKQTQNSKCCNSLENNFRVSKHYFQSEIHPNTTAKKIRQDKVVMKLVNSKHVFKLQNQNIEMNIQYLLAPVDSALCISFLSLLEVPRRKADGRRKTEQTTLGQGREGITSAVHYDAFRQYLVHWYSNEFPINKIKVCIAKGLESNMN